MTNKSGRKLKSWLNQHFKDQQAGEENKKPFSLKAISENILTLEKIAKSLDKGEITTKDISVKKLDEINSNVTKWIKQLNNIEYETRKAILNNPFKLKV